MGDLVVRSSTDADRPEIERRLTASWGGLTVIGHGVEHDLTALPALVAERDAVIAGLLTFHVDDEGLEVVTIDAFEPRGGVGSALLAAAVDLAKALDTPRLWLVTTNDNLDALRFYQRRGMRIVGVSAGAVDAARRVKPTIPEVGAFDIPVRDELTLELLLV